MSCLDRKDLLSADLMTRSITKEGSIKYYNTDKNVANIYMKLMAESPDGAQKEVLVDEASNYTVTIDVIKPKTNQIRTVPGVLSTDLTDETCAIWKFELGEDFTNQIGEVICQTYIKNSTQNLTMRYFAYTVEADKLTGLNAEIVTDPDLPILKELIKKVEELQANGGGGSVVDREIKLIADLTIDASNSGAIRYEFTKELYPDIAKCKEFMISINSKSSTSKPWIKFYFNSSTNKPIVECGGSGNTEFTMCTTFLYKNGNILKGETSGYYNKSLEGAISIEIKQRGILPNQLNEDISKIIIDSYAPIVDVDGYIKIWGY